MNRKILEVGCGVYLLGSSITTLLTTIMFGLKFFILLFSQMSNITNRSFLLFQCYSFDFLLRTFLCMDQWLNASVACERAFTTIRGPRFNKKTSQRTAKLVIIILFIIIVVSSIHDPIYRKLIDETNDDDDNNQNRIWCIVTYSSGLQFYNSFIHAFHFIIPFIINLISAIVLIIKKSHQQINLHTEQSYKTILVKQIREHKHLLYSPIALVILSIPRIIFIFISKCMNSSNDSWLFLTGYFISFIPSVLTFTVFVTPSKFYKDEFRKAIRRYRNNIQLRLHLKS
jgi:hypothetical protein